MWKNKKKMDLERTENSDGDTISSMLYKDSLYIGKEDGKLECYDSQKKYSAQCFTLKFDYLESRDVIEKITSFEKIEAGGVSYNLIVGNERNIKVFNVRNDECTKNIIENKLSEQYNINQICEFNNVHSYILNNISTNNDSTYFISSDYLKVNLWRPDRLEGCYTLIDIKPQKYSDLVYVINLAKFSKHHNTIFGYPISLGEILLNDLRISSKSENITSIKNSKLASKDAAFKSVSDFSFIDESLILSRNLNTVSLYDIKNPSKEIFTVDICENVFDNPMVFDTEIMYEKFKVCNNKRYGFTGCFENKVYVIDLLNGDKDEIKLEYDHEILDKNKVKFVVSKDDGFIAIYDNVVYEYVNDEL